jgi:hypothetical protein
MKTALTLPFFAGMLALAATGCQTGSHYHGQGTKPAPYEDPYHEVPFEQNPQPVNPKYTRTYQSEDLPSKYNEEPEVIQPSQNLPTSEPVLNAIPIEDKPGFVLSPYAPDKGLVDVRDFAPGTEVKDPYTGKIMKIPTFDKTKKPKVDLPAPLGGPTLNPPPTGQPLVPPKIQP